MDKKTIYFHIGTHKTGSTAIQKFLLENEQLMHKKGFIYSIGIKNNINHIDLSHDETLWETIQLDSNYNYIFSSEDFYFKFFGQRKEIALIKHLRTYKDKFSQHNIKVIVYLRRQDLFSESLNNEIIKRHGFSDEYTLNIVPLDYYKYLHELSNFIPLRNIHVRPYESNQFVEGSIYNDFTNILGLKLTDEYHIDRRVVNPSLSTEKMELSKYINMLNLSIGFRIKFSQLIIKSALDSHEVSLFRKQGLIAPNEAKELLERYNVGNENIAREFLGRENGRLFYEEISEDPDWKPFPGLSPKVALEILQQINKMDNQVLENLYELIISTPEKNKKFVKAANFLTPLLINILKKNIIFQPLTIRKLKLAKNFEQLKQNLEGWQESADILREVALAFEESGDIQTALKVMQQAYMLRPEGPAINQKVNKYKKLLNQQTNNIND